MKTRMEVLKAIEDGILGKCFDGRDRMRLANFFELEFFPKLGVEIKDEYQGKDLKLEVLPWEESSIVEMLKDDIAFAFEKALNKRGISSSLMYDVIKMWLWILEDDLYRMEEYDMYGLPLYKAVALKYGFNNPIGEDTGSEKKYDMEE